MNGCQEALFSGCEGAVPVFGPRIAQPCVPGRPAGRPGTQMLRRESTEGAGSAQRCSCGPLMGDVGVIGWPVAHVARAASDGEFGRGAVIDPYRGRRARRRPLLGSSTRSPCPSPCHATAGAAPVLHPWTNPSSTPSATRRGTHGRRACPTLFVCALPCANAGVQPLRPGPDLLRLRLCGAGSPAVAA